MSAKVKFASKIDVTGLYFEVLNDLDEYLNSSTGLFEVWNALNVALYKTLLTLVPNSNGIHAGIVPAINVAILPADVNIFVFDPATVAISGAIGQGRMRIDRNNNEQPNDLLLYNIFAATVFNNLGVGTIEEEYYGHDNFLAFTSVFDTAGNRSVTVGGL
jgi:hypothetical protein